VCLPGDRLADMRETVIIATACFLILIMVATFIVHFVQ